MNDRAGTLSASLPCTWRIGGWTEFVFAMSPVVVNEIRVGLPRFVASLGCDNIYELMQDFSPTHHDVAKGFFDHFLVTNTMRYAMAIASIWLSNSIK
jgi:hypothetical protein